MELLSGWWPEIIVIILLVLGFSWFARYQQRHGRSLGKPQEATIKWLGSYTEGFQRILDLLPQIQAALIDADANLGLVVAAAPGSALSGGTTLRINLLTQEGVTFINVEAAPSAGLFDLGASRRLVNRFIQLWERLPSPVAA